MTVTVTLGEKAHCRYGDKGDTGLFVVIPYDGQDFDALVAGVTAAQVSCRPYPELGALVIVVRGSLRGGVTSSLALDAHGKTQSGYLLGMQVPWNKV